MDSGQIHQALTNVLVNALQATPAGGEVRVALRDAGETFSIEIQDQGVGIAAEHLSHIFEPFFTTKRAGEGTGLGLSVAEGIIRQHGGTITAESRSGQGTLFRIQLPKLG
jgi:signal transduction histidine kinase